MKPNDFIDLDPFAVALAKKAERESPSATKSPPVPAAPPAIESLSAAAALSDAQPQPPTPESQSATESPPAAAAQSVTIAQPEEFAGSVILPESPGFLKMPNYILDHLPSVIGTDAFMVYLRLYRLSFGFQKPTCQVSVKRIAETIGISERSVQRCLGLLERRGLARRVPTALHYAPGGNEFEVFEPITTAALAQGVPLALPDELALPAAKADNKRTLKKDSNKTSLLARYERLRDGNTITSDTEAPLTIRITTLRGLVLRAGLAWVEEQGREVLEQ